MISAIRSCEVNAKAVISSVAGGRLGFDCFHAFRRGRKNRPRAENVL